MKGKRILLYVRVSTEEQARYGESIADQRQALSEWAKKHGCVVVHEFVDEGFSARKPYKSRPALCALLNAVENREAMPWCLRSLTDGSAISVTTTKSRRYWNDAACFGWQHWRIMKPKQAPAVLK